MNDPLALLPSGWRTRIAPTPSGLLHPGNGASFLLTWRLAQVNGGRVMLRIDDLDTPRVRLEHVSDIFDTLAWLGIAPAEGPADPDDLVRKWSQTLRIPLYQALLAKLRATGLLYACSCSRKDVRMREGDDRYDGHCRERGIDLDAPAVTWRLRLPDPCVVHIPGPYGDRSADLGQGMGDPVVRQRDGRPAYQIASLADDLHFGMGLIVRGEDLLLSTACQLHIAQVTGLERAAVLQFIHHPLLLGEDGLKLSKSHGAGSLRAWRDAGTGPESVEALAEGLLTAVARGFRGA